MNNNHNLGDTIYDNLKRFLIRRTERKRRLRNVSDDIKRFYKVLQLPMGLKIKSSK